MSKSEYLKSMKHPQQPGASTQSRRQNLMNFMLIAPCRHFTPPVSDDEKGGEKLKQSNDRAA